MVALNIKTKTIRGRIFLLFFLLHDHTQKMLRVSQILPKIERRECVVSYVAYFPQKKGGGGGRHYFRFFIFPLKNDRDEIGILRPTLMETKNLHEN